MLTYRNHEERVMYLYIEGTDLEGQTINVGQVACIYSKNQQANINMQIYNNAIYENNKTEIEAKIESFRLECEELLKRTEMVLFGSNEETILKTVYDEIGNRIGVIKLAKE